MADKMESVTMRLLARPEPGRPLEPHDIDELDALRAEGRLIWLDVAGVDAALLDELGARFGFAESAIEDVLDVEQLPKYDDHGDHLFVVLHGLTAEGDRVDTHEVDCFIAPKVFVTVHAERVVGIDWLWAAVQKHAHLAEHDADELFGQLAEVVGRRYFNVANAIEARIDGLAAAALDADPTVLGEIQVLRREEATVRQMLRPQLLALGELRVRNRTLIGEGAVDLLDDAYDVHNSVVEALATARGLLTDTLDTYRGASADIQSKATTLLAVYSAVLLPLSLITGWYGMNVAHLPAADRRNSWWVVTAIMAFIAVVSMAIFVKIDLIRLPRDRTDRIIGGLASVAKAPVKPFTMLRTPTTAAASKARTVTRARTSPPRQRRTR